MSALIIIITIALTIKLPKNSGVVNGKNLANKIDLIFMQTLIFKGSEITAYILGLIQEAADLLSKKFGRMNNNADIPAAYVA